MPSATLRVASQKELITIVFGEHSTRSVEEGIPKRSLGTRKRGKWFFNPFLYTIPVVMFFYNRY
jgi:hypothetical protein